MQIDSCCDIVILGGGPAGAAAAIFAAERGLKATLLEREARPPVAVRPEWLHAAGHQMLDLAGVPTADTVLGTIGRVRFVDLAAGREAWATPSVKTEMVDSARLLQAMLARARAAGVAVRTGTEVTTIETHEQRVTLKTASGKLSTGRLLVAADGHDSRAVDSLGLDSGKKNTSETACCQSVFRRPSPSIAAEGPETIELTWIPAADDLAGFGYLFGVGTIFVAGLVAPTSTDSIVGSFQRAVAQWESAGLLPNDLDLMGGDVDVRRVPRPRALDMDTHVAKNSIVIGDAGGYVQTVSLEGLYPAIWSAKLAIEVCQAALGAEHPQDRLAEFDSLWRREMVEYLRLPSADLRFLLPLVFTNDLLAQRFADALLAGLNI
jgi:flavin-dependent dehydrogenase